MKQVKISWRIEFMKITKLLSITLNSLIYNENSHKVCECEFATKMHRL